MVVAKTLAKQVVRIREQAVSRVTQTKNTKSYKTSLFTSLLYRQTTACTKKSRNTTSPILAAFSSHIL
jgi:hypothetical protein